MVRNNMMENSSSLACEAVISWPPNADVFTRYGQGGNIKEASVQATDAKLINKSQNEWSFPYPRSTRTSELRAQINKRATSQPVSHGSPLQSQRKTISGLRPPSKTPPVSKSRYSGIPRYSLFRTTRSIYSVTPQHVQATCVKSKDALHTIVDSPAYISSSPNIPGKESLSRKAYVNVKDGEGRDTCALPDGTIIRHSSVYGYRVRESKDAYDCIMGDTDRKDSIHSLKESGCKGISTRPPSEQELTLRLTSPARQTEAETDSIPEIVESQASLINKQEIVNVPQMRRIRKQIESNNEKLTRGAARQVYRNAGLKPPNRTPPHPPRTSSLVKPHLKLTPTIGPSTDDLNSVADSTLERQKAHNSSSVITSHTPEISVKVLAPSTGESKLSLVGRPMSDVACSYERMASPNTQSQSSQDTAPNRRLTRKNTIDSLENVSERLKSFSIKVGNILPSRHATRFLPKASLEKENQGLPSKFSTFSLSSRPPSKLLTRHRTSGRFNASIRNHNVSLKDNQQKGLMGELGDKNLSDSGTANCLTYTSNNNVLYASSGGSQVLLRSKDEASNEQLHFQSSSRIAPGGNHIHSNRNQIQQTPDALADDILEELISATENRYRNLLALGAQSHDPVMRDALVQTASYVGDGLTSIKEAKMSLLQLQLALDRVHLLVASATARATVVIDGGIH